MELEWALFRGFPIALFLLLYILLLTVPGDLGLRLEKNFSTIFKAVMLPTYLIADEPFQDVSIFLYFQVKLLEVFRILISPA